MKFELDIKQMETLQVFFKNTPLLEKTLKIMIIFGFLGMATIPFAFSFWLISGCF